MYLDFCTDFTLVTEIRYTFINNNAYTFKNKSVHKYFLKIVEEQNYT